MEYSFNSISKIRKCLILGMVGWSCAGLPALSGGREVNATTIEEVPVNVLLCGREEPAPDPIPLRAGPLTMIFEPDTVFLRYICKIHTHQGSFRPSFGRR